MNRYDYGRIGRPCPVCNLKGVVASCLEELITINASSHSYEYLCFSVESSRSRGRRCSESGFRPGLKKENQMTWKAPTIVEVPVGMEINMYMCATRK